MINYDKGGKNMEEKETKKTLKQVKKLRRKIKNFCGYTPLIDFFLEFFEPMPKTHAANDGRLLFRLFKYEK